MANEPRRRDILVGLAVGGAILAVGCDPKILGETETDDTDADTDGDTAASGDWLVGGTDLLAASYAFDFDDTCAQTCELTLGPCYAQTIDRQDVSEGVEGLPARMAFKVVDADCNPVEGAVVDIWHCAPNGLYSAPDAANMCTNGDADARASRWFRGMQTTNADGEVRFDTCMPGWYRGRAVHVHFQVRVGSSAYVTSQLGFPEVLNSDVFSNHPLYAGYGLPDTPNAQDNILSSQPDMLFAWRQASDGALLLSKTITLRDSLSDPTC